MRLLEQLIANTETIPQETTMSRAQVVNTLKQLLEELDETTIQTNRCSEPNPNQLLWSDN